MGCVSSHLLNQDGDFTQISTTSALSHHIVSLTSTTYGLLTLDPSSSPTTVPPTPPPRFTLSSLLYSEPPTEPPPEVIDSLELMAGLDSTPENERLYFSPQPSKPSPFRYAILEKPHTFQENANPNRKNSIFNKSVDYKPVIDSPELMAGLDSTAETRSLCFPPQYPILDKTRTFQENPNPNHKNLIFVKSGDCKPVLLDGFGEFGPFKSNPDHKNPVFIKPGVNKSGLLDRFGELCPENSNPDHKKPIFIKPGAYKPNFLDGFEKLCPPKGENRLVIYTTSLRGVRKTFEACNAVRAVLEGFGVSFCERDISMDRGFKQELWELMKGKDKQELVPPRVFVKGRYVGGSDEVLKIVEEGCLGRVLEGLPKAKAGHLCEVCGGARFLPCVVCNGSCKLVVVWKKGIDGEQLGKNVSVKCSDCNENGLVCCPVCS